MLTASPTKCQTVVPGVSQRWRHARHRRAFMKESQCFSWIETIPHRPYSSTVRQLSLITKPGTGAEQAYS